MKTICFGWKQKRGRNIFGKVREGVGMEDEKANWSAWVQDVHTRITNTNEKERTFSRTAEFQREGSEK